VTRVVLKLGGRVAAAAVQQAIDLHEAGDEVVVVHGAGPQITDELEAHGIEFAFRNGRRVTDQATLDVVRRSLVSVGAQLTSAIGPRGVHLVGDEIGLEARQLPELGLVGEPLACAAPAVENALAEGSIPVVTPIAVGPLNVNADEAAAALAVGIQADRISFVSDVPGVYLEGLVVDRLHVDRADELLGSGTFEGGIVPKLDAAVRAARLGIAVEIGATEVVASGNPCSPHEPPPSVPDGVGAPRTLRSERGLASAHAAPTRRAPRIAT
jgi:acetylglutamate kinase